MFREALESSTPEPDRDDLFVAVTAAGSPPPGTSRIERGGAAARRGRPLRVVASEACSTQQRLGPVAALSSTTFRPNRPPTSPAASKSTLPDAPS